MQTVADLGKFKLKKSKDMQEDKLRQGETTAEQVCGRGVRIAGAEQVAGVITWVSVQDPRDGRRIVCGMIRCTMRAPAHWYCPQDTLVPVPLSSAHSGRA